MWGAPRVTNSDALLEGRVLRWPECLNARDLGGLLAHDGVESNAAIQRGRVVRTEVPVYLTEAGWRALLAHGVRTVIDLRSPIEIEMDGYTLPAYASGVEHLEIAMLPQDAEMSRLLESTTCPGEEYILFVERYRERIANVLRAMAAARSGGVLYHCQGGKDRTGIITALLLALVGVPEQVIIADYAASQRLLMPRWERWVAEALDAGLEPPQQPVTEPGTMRMLLGHIDARYGGAAGYMEAIGVTQATRRRLIERLLY